MANTHELMRHLQPQSMLSHAPNGADARRYVCYHRREVGAAGLWGFTVILSTELVVVQVEGSKDRGKAHDWAEGAEVEAGEWAGTPDPAALDAWHREPSPEASRPAPDAAQIPGDVPPLGDRITLPLQHPLTELLGSSPCMRFCFVP